MKIDNLPKYFLGANSASGFINEFTNCFDPYLGYKAYIIKGGPGTGKSTLMKKAAVKATELGEECILCPCSSDPSSLDAVILPDRKTVVLDGTPPHTVEPKYPAVCEQIINTGAFWDENKISENRENLFKLFALNSAYHKRASQYVAAAGQLARYNFSSELSCTDLEKAFRFGCSLANHYIPKTQRKGKNWVRFLSGITPEGCIFYSETLEKFKNKIVICDRHAAVSSIFLSAIRDIALNHGYEIITVKNFLLPDEIIDHILIPELSLAFCTENENLPLNTDSRRIHSRRFTDMKKLNENRQKINFNRKIISELLNSGVSTLKTAKNLHDKIEKYYIDSIDFNALDEYTEQTVNKIFI